MDLGYVALTAVYIGLNVLDLRLTLAVINAGGRELNPIMRPLVRKPKWVLWCIKLSLASVVASGLLLLAVSQPDVARIGFAGLIGVMAVVCLHNARQLSRHLKRSPIPNQS
jgi:hypothetical protein